MSDRDNAHLRFKKWTQRSPELLNAELSRLAFTERIIERAEDPALPLLERTKFYALAVTNLDEFFMIHVARFERLLRGETSALDHMRFLRDRRRIAVRITTIEQRLAQLWSSTLEPALAGAGVALKSFAELDAPAREVVTQWFVRELRPHLQTTPLTWASQTTLESLAPGLLIVEDGQVLLVQAPASLPSLLCVRRLDPQRTHDDPRGDYVSSVDLMHHFSMIAAASEGPPKDIYALRITREADDDPDYDDHTDPISAIEGALAARKHARCVRLELDVDAPADLRARLARYFDLLEWQVRPLHRIPRQLEAPSSLARDLREHSELHYAPLHPYVPDVVREHGDLFAILRQRDLLLYHPYDSFDTVLEFIRQAAHDPSTESLWLTLYRVGAESPLLAILRAALANGKRVVVFVELRARFDEHTNIAIARELEAAGAEIEFGPAHTKVHAKACLVERREGDLLRGYVHLGTGNYHHVTASSYVDLGILTSDLDLVTDITDFLRSLHGGLRTRTYTNILVAPAELREALAARIRRIIANQRNGVECVIKFKTNALVDDGMIELLYEASRAGVSILLHVRGCCRLRPKVPGLSENIDVVSFVGRFLEHARLYYFREGTTEELLSGSADLMPRNLERRVELLFPIKDPALRAAILDEVLDSDPAGGQQLMHDGSYEPVSPRPGQRQTSFQTTLAAHGGRWRCIDNAPCAGSKDPP